jgi:hypothetical protein
MRMTTSEAGLGVTIGSRFPSQNAYYRLRRFAGTSFHLLATGTSITGGSADTGVTPIPGLWYRFLVEFEDTGGETRIRAKVWDERDPEPIGFQVDAFDDSPTRIVAGTFGIWASGPSAKYWDDIVVEAITPPRDDIVVTAVAGAGGAVTVTPLQATYSTNELVTFEAIPDPGFLFTGWSGDVTGGANPFGVAITDDFSLTASFVEAVYLEGFDGADPGDDPADWVDTAANSSLSVDDSLFGVLEIGGNPAFGTTSTAVNIHSHYAAAGASALADYEYGGRMRVASTNGGAGVTFLSQFTGSAAYYRLRRYTGTSFHIAPVGTSITAGTTDTGVTPLPNTWYRFRIQAEDVGGRTEIRAKVWQDGSTEPIAWQVDCSDDSPSRLVAGTVGIWSMADGAKHWDDLRISLLAPPDPCPGDTDLDGDGSCDSVDNCPPSVSHPLGWSNPSQSDADSDGSGDVCDNCLAIANGPLAYAPGLAAVSQCDRDSDGYGNACDGDLDQDGFVTPLDTTVYLPDLAAFFPTPPGQTDLSCDAFVTPNDNTLFIPQLGGFFPGPSGRACAGAVTGACPP